MLNVTCDRNARHESAGGGDEPLEPREAQKATMMSEPNAVGLYCTVLSCWGFKCREKMKENIYHHMSNTGSSNVHPAAGINLSIILPTPLMERGNTCHVHFVTLSMYC